LFTNAEMMADVLDEDMPELSKEDPKKKQEDDFEGNEEETEVSVEPGTGASSLWEDDDVKNFYENLGLFSKLKDTVLSVNHFYLKHFIIAYFIFNQISWKKYITTYNLMIYFCSINLVQLLTMNSPLFFLVL
jgi:hypothetical protein